MQKLMNHPRISKLKLNWLSPYLFRGQVIKERVASSLRVDQHIRGVLTLAQSLAVKRGDIVIRVVTERFDSVYATCTSRDVIGAIIETKVLRSNAQRLDGCRFLLLQDGF